VEKNNKENRAETPAESSHGKILIIKPSSLGDIIHSLPFLGALRGKYPDAYIAWLVNRELSAFLKGNPLIDEIIEFERQEWAGPIRFIRKTGGFLKFVRCIRERRFDICIDLQGLFRSAFLAGASGAPLRMGLADAREFGSLFYNAKVVAPTKDMHAVDRYLLFGLPLGLEDVKVEFPINITKAAEAKAAELVPRKKGHLVIGISPAARWPTKRLPIEIFAEVAAGISRNHEAQFVLLGTEADKENIDKLEELLHNGAVNLAGRTTLADLSAVIRRMDLLLTNDSAPMHLADALGVKLVAVFGPTSPVRTGPYFQRENVVRARLECAPCFKKKCNSPRCMLEMDAGEILAAAEKVLGEAK